MAKEKPPPPHHSRPDYNPEPEAEERTPGDDPRVREFESPRNRNVSARLVQVTVAVVLALGLLYFLFRL